MDTSTKKLVKIFLGIIIVMVVILIILFIYMGIASKKVSNDRLLSIMEESARKYYEKNSSNLPINNKTTEVTTATLISEGYMKSFDKLTSNKNCSGKVIVTNNGGNYIYSPSLKCDSYSTSYLVDKLKSTVVTSGDGLYQDGDIYYYRGEYPNNYIKLGDKTYRIMSIDEFGYIKVIDPTTTSNRYEWDDRYSHDMGVNYGINTFSKSRINEYYNLKYTDYSELLRSYIVKHDWCIEKRNIEDYDIHAAQCSEISNNYLGMINTLDYARISLDTNCTDIRGGSCNNYNYLSNMLDSNIWTAAVVNNNTYQAYSFESGFDTHNCNSKYKLLFLFHIDGNNLYLSGNGSEDSPYIIR